jgi:putative peptidoglycan lipid II flippase
LNLPASAGLAFLGVPIIAVLFEYGRFTATDTLATAWALAAYALGLCAYSAVKVLVPACYAMGNTRSAVISSLISILTTLLLNVWTVKVLGYPGLALGTSIAAMLNAVYLIWRLSNLLAAEGGKLQTGRIFFAFLQHTLVAVAMGATCWATWSWGWSPLQSLWVEAWGASGIIVVGIRALGVALLIAEGLVVLLLLARLFGIVETVEANRYLLGAFKRKLGIKS